jgi:hypothetical protein
MLNLSGPSNEGTIHGMVTILECPRNPDMFQQFLSPPAMTATLFGLLAW